MKTCDKCIYYEPTKTVKNIGRCKAPMPYWAREEEGDWGYVAAGNKGVAPLCETYTEEQDERKDL